ncbi:MAG: hypothetical protein HQK83_09460 [Fibrobacteria bacterium]|nr:hypothetical protein [Fibrobacteria bacterium]
MKIQKDEIIDLASRYVPVENPDFAEEGDLFYFLNRKLPNNKVLKDNEGWQFGGYGQCRGYVIDEAEKPRGKWIYMYYLDLARFPLVEEVLRVQPPHVVLGQFSSSDRSIQIRMVKCRPLTVKEQEEKKAVQKRKKQDAPDNIIAFPGKKQ